MHLLEFSFSTAVGKGNELGCCSLRHCSCIRRVRGKNRVRIRNRYDSSLRDWDVMAGGVISARHETPGLPS